MKKIIEQIQAT